MLEIKDNRLQELLELQKKINYYYKDIKLLNRALTHSSYANEHKKYKVKYNERLEFLGDSVLSIVISDYIFNTYPHYPEGELTKLRAIVVCENSLATISKRIEIGQYLLLGKGEEATGGRERLSILADLFEALLGSIYLDGGLESAKKFILDNFKDIINKAATGRLFLDYKTQLQELIQRNSKSKLEYRVIKEEGPDHNKVFHVEVKDNQNVLGKGSGKSKKEAEQNAAKIALEGVES